MLRYVFGRWLHARPVVWTVRSVLALSVLAVVVFAWDAAVALTDRYWPRDRPLSIEEAFQVGQFIVLLFGLTSVVLLWKQNKDTAKWNKLLSYHQFFSDCPTSERRAAMLEVLERRGATSCLKNGGMPVSNEFVTEVVAHSQDHQAIRLYLDDFEQLCGAVNCGVIDESYVRCLERTRVLRIFTVFQPLITHHQDHNSCAYLEFERLASKWAELREREEAEEARREAEEAKKRMERRHANGVPRRAPTD